MAPTGGSSPRARSLREALDRAADGERSLLNRAESTATQRARRHKRAKPLTLLPLVALCFYDVSGGPFGIEVIPPPDATLLLRAGRLLRPGADQESRGAAPGLDVRRRSACAVSILRLSLCPAPWRRDLLELGQGKLQQDRAAVARPRRTPSAPGGPCWR